MSVVLILCSVIFSKRFSENVFAGGGRKTMKGSFAFVCLKNVHVQKNKAKVCVYLRGRETKMGMRYIAQNPRSIF